MSQVTLRLPDSLHKRAKLLAQEDHVSLNTMITVALARKNFHFRKSQHS